MKNDSTPLTEDPTASSEVCLLSNRADGKHSWQFDGDDPYVKCVYCGEVRDTLSGRVIAPLAYEHNSNSPETTTGTDKIAQSTEDDKLADSPDTDRIETIVALCYERGVNDGEEGKRRERTIAEAVAAIEKLLVEAKIKELKMVDPIASHKLSATVVDRIETLEGLLATQGEKS